MSQNGSTSSALNAAALPAGVLTPVVAVAAIGAALNANVLVLNRYYQAIRVINVRRAFSLLCRDLAEVVHIEKDAAGQSRWQNFDFAEWRELSLLKREFEPEGHDWIRTVRFDVAVPRIIRLLGYDKLPRQDVKFNRRNIYARDGSKCQYCGRRYATTELSLDHVIPKSQGGKANVDEHRLLLREVQRQERRPDAGAGAHAPDHQAGQAAAEPGHQHQAGRRAVPQLAAVPGHRILDGGAEVTAGSRPV